MANNDNFSLGNLAGIFQAGIQGQPAPASNDHIMNFIAAQDKSNLDSQTELQKTKMLTDAELAKANINSPQRQADAEIWKQLQLLPQLGPKAQADAEVYKQQQLIPLQVQKNQDMLALLGLTSGNKSSEPAVNTPPQPNNHKVITSDGRTLTGQAASDYLAERIVGDEEHNLKSAYNAGNVASFNSGVSKLQTVGQASSLGYQPKISPDKNGNLNISFEQPDDKSSLEKQTLQRKLGLDDEYNNGQFPGYAPAPGAGLEQLSPRIQKELKTAYSTADNVSSNIDQMKKFIQEKGIPRNPKSSEYRQFQNLYSNAMMQLADTGGSGATDDSSGIPFLSPGRKKYLNNLIPNPTDLSTLYHSDQDVMRQLDNAKSIIRGDLDSTLKAYNYEPNRVTIEGPDGSLYSAHERDAKQAQTYLSAKPMVGKDMPDMPESLTMIKAGTAAKVPQNKVPISRKDGSIVGYTSASNLEKDKQALRAQGEDIL